MIAPSLGGSRSAHAQGSPRIRVGVSPLVGGVARGVPEVGGVAGGVPAAEVTAAQVPAAEVTEADTRAAQVPARAGSVSRPPSHTAKAMRTTTPEAMNAAEYPIDSASTPAMIGPKIAPVSIAIW